MSNTRRKKVLRTIKTHGGGPDAGNIGKLKDAMQKFKDKGLGKKVKPKFTSPKDFQRKMPQDIPSTRDSRNKEMKAMKKFQLGKKYSIGGRANLLEEMGRIDARRHPDAADRAEKRRVIGELNRGYKSGGAVLKGKKVGCQIK